MRQSCSQASGHCVTTPASSGASIPSRESVGRLAWHGRIAASLVLWLGWDAGRIDDEWVEDARLALGRRMVMLHRRV